MKRSDLMEREVELLREQVKVLADLLRHERAELAHHKAEALREREYGKKLRRELDADPERWEVVARVEVDILGGSAFLGDPEPRRN